MDWPSNSTASGSSPEEVKLGCCYERFNKIINHLFWLYVWGEDVDRGDGDDFVKPPPSLAAREALGGYEPQAGCSASTKTSEPGRHVAGVLPVPGDPYSSVEQAPCLEFSSLLQL